MRRRRSDDPTPVELYYTKSTGLYPTCAWDPKLVRRLILRGELAPRYPGRDDQCPDAREECPICMLVYPVLNETRCCSARLCTECYLQIRPPRHNKEPCPFCKYKRVEATYKGPRDQADIEREQDEEKRAHEAMKRANALAVSPLPPQNPSSSTASTASTSPSPTATVHLMEPIVETHSEPVLASPSMRCDTHLGNLENTPATSCTCKSPERRACREDHRARYFHPEKARVIDPLLLEAMASEATYSSGNHLERGSASSSSVLDVAHNSALDPSRSSHSSTDRLDYFAPLPRVVHLPWYGVDVTPENAGPSVAPPYSESDQLFEQEDACLKEAIRRSLIDM